MTKNQYLKDVFEAKLRCLNTQAESYNKEIQDLRSELHITTLDYEETLELIKYTKEELEKLNG